MESEIEAEQSWDGETWWKNTMNMDGKKPDDN